MLINKWVAFVLFGLFCLLCTAPVQAKNVEWSLIHGEVLQVFEAEKKILLATEGQILILELETDCELFRLGQATSLRSLRPVSSDRFQDVLCWVNPFGFVGCLWANYTIKEEKGNLVNYDIFGKQK